MKRILAGGLATLLLSGCVFLKPQEPQTTYITIIRDAPIKVTGKNEQIVATKLAQIINSKDDLYEYGAFISCDSLSCWSSDLAYGSTNSISTFEVNRIFPDDLPDTVVGFIHSHPKDTSAFKDTQRVMLNELNKSPSSNDYFAMEEYASRGKVYQPFNLWIIAPDNTLRKYPLPQ